MRIRPRYLLLGVGLALLLLTACPPVSPVIELTGISLDTERLSLLVGDSQQISVTVQPVDAADPVLVWSSSDAAVATVSVEGLVTAENAGSALITASTEDGVYAAECSVVVSPVLSHGDPVQFKTSGSARDVAVQGDYAYLFVTDGIFLVADVSNPAAPVEVAELSSLTGWYGGLSVAGDYAYLGTRDSGFYIIDISTPTAPVIVANYDPGADVEIEDVYYDAASGLAFLSEKQRGFEIVDAETPSAPISLAVVDPPGDGYTSDIRVVGDYCIVADKSAGLHVYNIQTPANPTLVKSLDTPGIARRIAVDGNYLYLADERDSGLRIYDITDVTSPSFELSLDCGNAVDVTVAGSRAYVAAGRTLYIVDISTPSTASIVTSYTSQFDSFWSIAASAGYLYGSDPELVVLDLADPDAPLETGRMKTGGSSTGVKLLGNYAFLAEGNARGLRIYDLSDPVSPTPVSFCSTIAAHAIDINDQYAYLPGYAKMQVIDFSDFENPSVAAEFSFAGQSSSIVVDGDYAYIGDFNNAVRVVDVSDPNNPLSCADIDLDDYVVDVAVRGSYLYAANNSDGLAVIDISNPASPQYQTNLGSNGKVETVTTAGDYCYFADTAGYLYIADLSDPAAPEVLGTFDIGCKRPAGILIDHNYAYLGSQRDGIIIVNVADPELAFVTHRIDTLGFPREIAITDGGELVIADEFGGLAVID